ncbi:hypothetical protein Tsp_07397 [Trichinella spiralis]|uniref:hypothetical protein n=1 Tax=Trichinella spiralis TaxID=6334 RepID=UPI0001EFCB3A|nr:hypothetical protein Tsp_07397 [Trichinella spiralis]
MHHYFASYSTVQYFLEHGLTAIDTDSANCRDVPLCVQKTRGRDVHSTLAAFEYNKKVIMIKGNHSKEERTVLLMSSSHTKLKIDNQRDDKRINITNDYKFGKEDVDSMDAKIYYFCFKRKTKRYTMLILYLIVDVCINNAFLLISHQQSYQKTKKRFMKELSARWSINISK